MSLPTTVPVALLETILNHIAALFLTGANGDIVAARQAASQMLNAYHPQTEDELRLAAKIIGFSFQALEALAQAAAPDMPLTRILRLRGGAVSLSRESAKAERHLAQLHKARQQGIPLETYAEPAQPKIEKAEALVQETATIAKAAKANGQTWTQAYEQRQRERRIAANLKKAESRFGTNLATTHPPIAQAI